MINKNNIDHSKTIRRLRIYRKCPFHMEYHVFFPFIGYIYLLFLLIKYHETHLFPILIALPSLVFFHVFLWLCTHWSVNFQTLMKYRKLRLHTNQISQATVVKVTPHKHKGRKELCPVLHETNPTDQSVVYYFQYHQKKYIYNDERKIFEKIVFPTRLPLREYITSHGHTTEDLIKQKSLLYGKNTYDIPLPTFRSLYREQALEPFFVFQIFCVLLWSLDEYWYYSLFMLALLLLFESTVVKSRLKNLNAIRDMIGKEPIQFYVYRQKRWALLPGDQLLPGDIVSIHRKQRSVPSDLVILSGSAIINEALLTGESTPKIKESLFMGRAIDDELLKRCGDELLQMHGAHKNSIIFSGTQIIQHSPEKGPLRSPDGGCICSVLITGFDTSQGKLMRSILFSQKRMTANNKESLSFIMFLLCFAITASVHVLRTGLAAGNRSLYKLFLNCTLIITSVVPPELPMELSLAVSNSLVALSKSGVFCTEPFRIPFGGGLNVCCFDKTGTLTSDDLTMKGVSGIHDNEKMKLVEPKDIPILSCFVIGGCHSLVHIEGNLVGDPMESSSLKAINWVFTKGDVALAKKGLGRTTLRILRRFLFSSELKRMSTIGSLETDLDIKKIFPKTLQDEIATAVDTQYFIGLSKGAPEVMKSFFINPPKNYDEIFKHYSRQGARVIALGWKLLPHNTSFSSIAQLDRSNIESELHFAGFSIFECPEKDDSRYTVEQLITSSHDVVMITGDNTLTACNVATDLGINRGKKILILAKDNQDPTSWYWINSSEDTKHSWEELCKNPKLRASFGYCVDGSLLPNFMDHKQSRFFFSLVQVFSRVSPVQKETIIHRHKDMGKITLMCGDGTNDVGALKQAQVGVALLKQSDSAKDNKANSIPESNVNKKQMAKNIKVATSLADLKKEIEDNELSPVQLGDASIASPFTCKGDSVHPVVDIVRQGRCTLVTMMQMYRILALNCLINAYVLSILYIDGVKLGDSQATVLGILTALCFLFISRSKPLPTLSKRRPQTTLFCFYMFFSIILQFSLHFYTLLRGLALAKQYSPPLSPDTIIDPDADFEPNLINSVMFFISCSLQTTTFLANYRGYPFVQRLQSNKGLCLCIIAIYSIIIASAFNIFPFLNTLLKISPFPNNQVPLELIKMLSINAVASLIIEKLLQFIFKK